MNARLEPGAPRPDSGSSEATGTDLSYSQHHGMVTYTLWPAPNSVVPQGTSVGTVSDQPWGTSLKELATQCSQLLDRIPPQVLPSLPSLSLSWDSMLGSPFVGPCTEVVRVY